MVWVISSRSSLSACVCVCVSLYVCLFWLVIVNGISMGALHCGQGGWALCGCVCVFLSLYHPRGRGAEEFKGWGGVCGCLQEGDALLGFWLCVCVCVCVGGGEDGGWGGGGEVGVHGGACLVDCLLCVCVCVCVCV